MDMNFFKQKCNPADLMRPDPECDFEGDDVIFGSIRMNRETVADFIYRAADLMDDGIPVPQAFDYVVRCIRDEFLSSGQERAKKK
jgi:hypothetical protein